MRIASAVLLLIALAGCSRRTDEAYRNEFRMHGERTCRSAAPAELADIGRWSEETSAGIPIICGCTLEVGMAEKSSDQLRDQSVRPLTDAERAEQREIFTVCVDEYLRRRSGDGGGDAGGAPGPGADRNIAAASERAGGGAAAAVRARADPPLLSLFSPDDYPASALRNEETGRVAFTLAIGPNGRVTECAISQSSGSAALDSTTCRILRSRARYRPARDARGQAVADRDRGAVSWRLPS
jgi:TonB family protein